MSASSRQCRVRQPRSAKRPAREAFPSRSFVHALRSARALRGRCRESPSIASTEDCGATPNRVLRNSIFRTGRSPIVRKFPAWRRTCPRPDHRREVREGGLPFAGIRKACRVLWSTDTGKDVPIPIPSPPRAPWSSRPNFGAAFRRSGRCSFSRKPPTRRQTQTELPRQYGAVPISEAHRLAAIERRLISC